MEDPWPLQPQPQRAAAVSAAIDGASPAGILDLALRAATRAEQLWSAPGGGSFADAVRHVHDHLIQLRELRPDDIPERFFPDGPLTIVPLALALATIMDSAEAATLLAANTGGDSDSVASIAGGVLGARCPATVNEDWYVVEQVNGHDLVSLAADLVASRH